MWLGGAYGPLVTHSRSNTTPRIPVTDRPLGLSGPLLWAPLHAYAAPAFCVEDGYLLPALNYQGFGMCNAEPFGCPARMRTSPCAEVAHKF